MTKLARLFLFLLLHLPLAALSAGAAEKPNVLFIAVDDLRPDLGCYGVKFAKSPCIDRLAAGGVVFERAYCQQAVCSPSRSSIMTGRRPDETKVWDLVTHFRSALPDGVTVSQHFKSHGYHAAALGKIFHRGYEDPQSWNEPHWYPKVNGEHSAPASGSTSNGKGRAKGGPPFEVSPRSDDELPDGATAAEAVKRLSALKAKGQPFFLAVGFVKPHLPFVAPKKYWDLHDPAAIPLPETDKLPDGTPSFTGHTNGELRSYLGVPAGEPLPADYARQLRHGYHACISYMDAQVGRLLDALQKEGLAGNTIIVLWGDHGWQLGDHGLWHKHTNFERAVRAPLIISVPGAAGAGRKCQATVEFVDVFPTLADICGLPVPAGLAGASLKPFLENPDKPSAKPAVSQYPRHSPQHGGSLMGYSIRTDRWRATFWRKRGAADIAFTELYDETSDPAETKNLATLPEHKDLLASLTKHLPPAGSDTPGPKSPAPGSQPKQQPGKQAGNKDGFDPAEPRDKRFDRLYPGKTALTLTEYLAAQRGDQTVATDRFKRMDQNSDGSLTREEFISQGRK